MSKENAGSSLNCTNKVKILSLIGELTGLALVMGILAVMLAPGLLK